MIMLLCKSCRDHSGLSEPQCGLLSSSVWEMEGAEVNDGHYAGLGLLVQCLFTGWSSISPALSLVALALMLADSDLLAPSAHCSLAPVHSRAVSDPTWSCSAGLGLMKGD